MIKILKTLLPLPLRNYFRPVYRYWCMRFANFCETIFGFRQQWNEKREQLLLLTTDEELYEFSQKEFGIIQNKIEILGLLEYLKKNAPEIIVEIGTKEGGNSLLFLKTLKKINTYIGIDVMVRNYGKLKYLVKNDSKIFSIHSNSRFPEVI